jgi:hypothetical protein
MRAWGWKLTLRLKLLNEAPAAPLVEFSPPFIIAERHLMRPD